MRVLHIISGTGVGGAEGVLLRLMATLQTKGVIQSVVSLAPLGGMAGTMREQGFPVSSAGLRTVLDLPRALWICRKRILEFKPDIVQTWMYHADLFGGLAARSAGVQRIVWGVRMSQMLKEMPRFTRLVIRLCALTSKRIPQRIVAAAESSLGTHLSLGYDVAHLTVIPNGFELPPQTDTMLRATARQSLKLPASTTLVIGAIGRYDPFKDQPTLLEAFARVPSKSPGVHLVLVGRGCDRSNAPLMALISRLNIEDSVTLVGERANARALLPAFDVYCLSSRSEGFPNVVGEAMAAGIPCVTTNVGDAAFLVGDTGIIVPPEDPSSLARGLQLLLDEAPDIRRARGVRARTRITRNFSIQRMTDSYFNLYSDMLAADSRTANN